jgi:hypothetical protein
MRIFGAKYKQKSAVCRPITKVPTSSKKIGIMKQVFFALLATLFTVNLNAQLLETASDRPPGSLTWPFLWDLTVDGSEHLYVCSEIGEFFIKKDGEWEFYDLDPEVDTEAFGVAVDSDSVAWVATDRGLFEVNNGEIIHHTTENSGLPFDNLRVIAANGNELWMISPQNGLIKKSGEVYTTFDMSNSPVETTSNGSIAVQENGRVIISTGEFIYFFDNAGNWQVFDLLDLFGIFNQNVRDVFVDHNQDIWFATNAGVLKYDNSSGALENMNSTYGQRNYQGILYTPQEELWVGQLFEGIHYFDSNQEHYFFEGGGSTDIPSQVFDMVLHNDTVKVTGNVGAQVVSLSAVFVDADNDGFFDGEDCDDSDPNINPDAEDIPNNGIDENCDGEDNIVSAEEQLRAKLKVFPNPASEVVYVEGAWSNLPTLALYSLDGKLVAGPLQATQLPLNGLAEGSYLLSVQLGDAVVTYQVSVQP